MSRHVSLRERDLAGHVGGRGGLQTGYQLVMITFLLVHAYVH